jgi:hypothetical protein
MISVRVWKAWEAGNPSKPLILIGIIVIPIGFRSFVPPSTMS